MITLTRKLARQLHTVMRRALKLPRGRDAPLFLSCGAAGPVIRAQSDQAAVEYHGEVPGGEASLSIPLSLIRDCAGKSEDPVTICQEDDQVVLRWESRGVPQVRQQPHEPETLADFPATPSKFVPVDASLWDALQHASETADKERIRYALDTLRLSGSRGSVVGTDGHQLFIQSGFEFPWEGDVLVPRNPVFGCPELPRDAGPHVGKTDRWLSLRCGPWTVHLAIDGEGRFPNVENVVPAREVAGARLRWSPADAEFVRTSVERLPVDEGPHRAVTVDLNGEAAIESSSPSEGAARLVLSNSTVEGETKFATNRAFLARAAGLGFGEVHVFPDHGKVLCEDGHRQYVWMTLAAEAMSTAEPAAVARIVSPRVKPANPKTPQPRTSNRMKSSNTTKPDANGNTDEQSGIDGMIEQAEALKSCLKDLQTQTSELLTGLKRHRKQSKLVKSTLQSLKQLQDIEA